MIRSIRTEFYKLMKRRRSYIGFVGYTVLLLLLYVALSYSKKPYLSREAKAVNLRLTDFMDGSFFCLATLYPSLALLYPIFISLVAGDLVAGESQEGTLRVMLARPGSRARVLGSKVAVLGCYLAVLCTFCGLGSLMVGTLGFGVPGDLLFPEIFYGMGNHLRIIPRNEALQAFFCSYVYAAFAGMVVGTLGLLLSVVCRHAASAVTTTLVIYFVFHILAALPPLRDLRPYFFTSHLEAWKYFFADPVPWGRIVRSAMVMLSYGATFGIMAWLFFERKDVHA